MFTHANILDKDVQLRKTNLSMRRPTAGLDKFASLSGDDWAMERAPARKAAPTEMPKPKARKKAGEGPRSQTKALGAYAANLKRWIGLMSPEKWVKQLEDQGKRISQSAKTLRRHMAEENEPTMQQIEEIANAMGYEAWQVLIPGVYAENAHFRPAEVSVRAVELAD